MGRGVRRGCCLSPLLFTIYTDAMMAEAMEGTEEGVKVSGKIVKDIQFADDPGMVASSERGLQSIMDRLEATAGKYEVKVNIKKTKVMKVFRNVERRMNITVGGHKIEQVESFKYLGSTITEDGSCE